MKLGLASGHCGTQRFVVVVPLSGAAGVRATTIPGFATPIRTPKNPRSR